jgi:hypothetical protein
MTVWYSLLLLTMTHLLLSWYSYELAQEKNRSPLRYALLAWCPLLNLLSLIHLLRLPTPPLNLDQMADQLFEHTSLILSAPTTTPSAIHTRNTNNLWV